MPVLRRRSDARDGRPRSVPNDLELPAVRLLCGLHRRAPHRVGRPRTAEPDDALEAASVTEIACSKLGCRATTTFTITNADLDDETQYDAQFGDDGWTTVNSP